MKALSIRDMRNSLGNLENLLEQTGELILTKNGQGIARIFPIHTKNTRPTHQELQNLTKKNISPSEEIIREMRNER